MVRKILAVLAGIVIGIIVISLVEMIGHAVYPTPDDIDIFDPAFEAEVMETWTGTLLFVLFAWAAGSFLGAIITSIISKDSKTILSLIVGALLMGLGILTLITIPHPVWFTIMSIFAFLPFAWLGSKTIK